MAKLGDKFTYSYADSRPTWIVKKRYAKGVYTCAVISDDWTGHERVFTCAEIDDAVAYDRSNEESRDEHSDFYRSLKFGDIVHYHGGFNDFTRCEVVRDNDVENSHGRALRPIALVGIWNDHDLPRRGHDGSVEAGYHARQIMDGKTFEPNFSNIYEARLTLGLSWGPRAIVDPRPLLPISLAVPDMTPSEAEAAELVKLVRRVGQIVEGDNSPQQKLEMVYNLVSSSKAKSFMRVAMRV